MERDWSKLARDGLVVPHRTGRREILALRRAIRRNLKDASLPGLSDDNRFGIAYEAALLAAKMALACAGYRVRGESAHETTFRALEIAVGSSATRFARYFQRCRRARNEISYERSGVVEPSEVTEIVEHTHLLQELVDAWIANAHPELA